MSGDGKACSVSASLLLAAVALTSLAAGASGQDGREGRGRRDGRPEVFQTVVPESRGNVILGRPTDRSVTLSVLLRDATKITVAYGLAGKVLDRHVGAVELAAGEPREILLAGLAADTAYAYRILDAVTGKPVLPEAGFGGFHTCRAAGSAFTFTVQADSHLDGNCRPDLYGTCLANVLRDRPDFHLDLGDTFMTGKHESRTTAAMQYAAQRYYFGLVGHAAPLFLVVGNHDGEEVRRAEDAGENGLAVWSCRQRKRWFPNPIPGGFYTGDTARQPWAGLLEDYFAWTWGDALFVVLDPYWTSRPTHGGTEPWNMTLGKAQYDWLAKTLRTSRATFKFVFIHQLTGGLDAGGRGGAEAAALYEWGGHEAGGQDTFAAHRPGWEKPVHDLLVETGVSVVFHGHDHFFAHQRLDGIVYQLVPQPAPRRFDRDLAAEYGYREGDFLPGAGHLRVRVAPSGVTIEYVRAATPDMERRGLRNGAVAFTYRVYSP